MIYFFDIQKFKLVVFADIQFANFVLKKREFKIN